MKNVTLKQMMLPATGALAATFDLVPFLGTREGENISAAWKAGTRISKTIHIIVIVFAIFMFVLTYIDKSQSRMFNALVLGGITYGIGYLIRKVFEMVQLNPVKKKYVRKRYAHSCLLAQEMVEHFGGYFYAFGDGYFFLYNQDLCLYVNTENGEWVGFDTGSIKNARLEHVHIGSTTTSNTKTSGTAIAWTSNFGTYSGSSTTVSETKSHYEWRLDVFSNFMAYPNLTCVFPDNKEGEDFVKKATAILSK